MNLWGQVTTQRGQILVISTGDATLRVLCCVLCVCALLVVCVVGVQCVGVCVCWCWCWCWCWWGPLLLPHHHHSSPRLYVQNARCVYIQNVPVCTGTTPASVTTCGRGAGTHGNVLNVHTGFSACHTTPHAHITTTTTYTQDVKVDIEVLESLLKPENSEVSLRYVLKYSTRRCINVFQLFDTSEKPLAGASGEKWCTAREWAKRVA